MREVDGYKVAFVEHQSYFDSMLSPSMYSTSRETGADVVMLLAPAKVADDVTDDDVRVVLRAGGLIDKATETV